MDFNLTEEQQMLQDMLSRLVRDHYSFEKRMSHYASQEGYSTAFWQQLADQGLTGVPIDETYGGFGGGGVENMLLMKELGRGLCLEPVLASQIFAAGLLQQLGNKEQKEKILPLVASGELKLAAALTETNSHYSLQHVACRARQQGDTWFLSGQKSVVVGGAAADLLLVSARTAGEQGDPEGISLFLVEPWAKGVTRNAYPCIDGPRACDLLLDEVMVGRGGVLGTPGQVFTTLQYQQERAAAAASAEALGSMEEAFTLTLDYLKTRQQFGQPIGKFQALQHRMADMRGELELATSMTLLAASLADHPPSDERSRKLAASRFIVTRAARFIAEQAIQLHGGSGMTWEYALAHHAKRLVMLSHHLGDEDTHLQRFADLLKAS